MATNEIEIEVTLDDKKALKGLDKLEKAGESVGEGFNALGSSVSAMGGELNETLVPPSVAVSLQRLETEPDAE